MQMMGLRKFAQLMSTLSAQIRLKRARRRLVGGLMAGGSVAWVTGAASGRPGGSGSAAAAGPVAVADGSALWFRGRLRGVSRRRWVRELRRCGRGG